jgi:hypothetical protein
MASFATLSMRRTVFLASYRYENTRMLRTSALAFCCLMPGWNEHLRRLLKQQQALVHPCHASVSIGDTDPGNMPPYLRVLLLPPVRKDEEDAHRFLGGTGTANIDDAPVLSTFNYFNEYTADGLPSNPRWDTRSSPKQQPVCVALHERAFLHAQDVSQCSESAFRGDTSRISSPFEVPIEI